ncbi:hypothetical protein AB4028_15110 [Janibacter sp. RAF20_2_2]
MVVPGRGVVRCARAAAWACAAGGLSVGAHVVGGGGLLRPVAPPCSP